MINKKQYKFAKILNKKIPKKIKIKYKNNKFFNLISKKYIKQRLFNKQI